MNRKATQVQFTVTFTRGTKPSRKLLKALAEVAQCAVDTYERGELPSFPTPTQTPPPKGGP